MPRIIKVVTIVEDVLEESGRAVGTAFRKVAVAAVIENPYAGRFSEDLGEIIEASVAIGDQLGARLVEAMGGPVQSYGKSAIVGGNGEVEHGHAFLTSAMADRLRVAVGGGAAWISSTAKRGPLGVAIDVPLASKDALKVRSHYDTMTVSIPDAPAPDEVVVVVTLVTKNSSVPTLITAFWLLSVAMRGLDSTCTLPCDSRKLSSAAKLLVCNASPNTDPGTSAPAIKALVAEPIKVLPPVPSGSGVVGLGHAGLMVTDEPGSKLPSAPRAVNDCNAPSVRKIVPELTMPAPKRPLGRALNAPQLMPVAN